MKLLSKTTVMITLAIIFSTCGQERKNNDMKNRPITQMYQDVDSISYPSMPQYYLEGYQSGCFYEIYVNGMLVFKHYKNVGLTNHAIPINHMILKGGVQNITIKLFPLGKIGEQEFNTLEEDTRFRLTIFKRNKATPWEGMDYDVVHEYFAPTANGKETGTFKHVGMPYYEETFTFNAQVPYKLKGWDDSQVLTEMDQDTLEQEILDFYKKYDNIIQNQDEQSWVNMVRDREKEYLESVHYNDYKNSRIKSRITFYKNTFDTELVEKIPLDSYKIAFLGDGKVVTLRSTKRPGVSAYSYAENKDRNGKRAKGRTSYYLLLHKPKGSNKLEIIR